MIVEGGEDEPEITGDAPGCGIFLEVVGADVEYDSAGMEGEHVFLQTDENAARGIATDSAIGDF